MFGHFIGNIDFHQTLDEFSRRQPEKFWYLIKHLNNDDLWRKLIDFAISERVFRSDVLSKIGSPQNGAHFVINEFRRINGTIGLLCICMKEHNFQSVFQLLGINEKIHVIHQPGNSGTPISTFFGKELKLSFVIKGYPNPRYQWFLNELAIPDAIDSSLEILHFSEENEGKYHCVAVQSGIPNLPQISLVSDTVECILLVRHPRIIVDLPPEITCIENEDIILSVEPDDDFQGIYDWFFSNQVLCRTLNNELCLKKVTKSDEGTYKCALKNRTGETYSSKCHLKVQVPVKPSSKLAVLIGNSEYSNFSNLKTPSRDVQLLAYTLKDMGFFVVSVLNLSISEFKELISWFSSIIPKKAFVFFYFTGHGFGLSNNKFLIPVSCPSSSSFKVTDCMSYDFIVQEIMSKKPLLLVSVLDMCLKGVDRSTNPQLYSQNIEHYGYVLSNSSIVEACATSDYQIAYEGKTEEIGLYCECLCNYIYQDMPVVTNFALAHEEFSKKRKKRQKPQLKFNNGSNDLKLNVKPEKDFKRLESRLIRMRHKSLILYLEIMEIYLLLVIVPVKHILNSIEVLILPLSEIKQLTFAVVCREMNLQQIQVLSSIKGDLHFSRLELHGLHKFEDTVMLHFRFKTYCDVKNMDVYDYARIIIEYPLILL